MLNVVEKTNSYHITFFTPKSNSVALQKFIEMCTKCNFKYTVTPYGITSVSTTHFRKEELLNLYREFFPRDKVQEMTVVFENTINSVFLPYKGDVCYDLSEYLNINRFFDCSKAYPIAITHHLELHEDMTWDFIERVMSFPSEFGRIVFSLNEIIFCIDIEVYFANLKDIISYFGLSGYIDILYSDGKTLAASKASYEGEVIEYVITDRSQIPLPITFVAVKPIWYDYEYR